MTSRHFNRGIVIRIFLLVVFTVTGCYFLFLREQFFWSIVAFLSVLFTAASALRYFNQVNRWLASFLLGIENDDTSLRVPDRTGNKAVDEIFGEMHRLNELFRQTKVEIDTQERYYLTLINQSDTGLFSVNESGRIININPAAEKLTGLIPFHHVNTLGEINESLPGFIKREAEPGEKPSAIYENKKGQKLLFRLSEITTPDEKIRLVVVSDITKELDIREVDAWIRLARTLSHEIMNNIAPITTLSQVALKYFTREGQAINAEAIDQGTVHKTIKGLKVIEERSSGLKEFVENYRKFTSLPEPKLKQVGLGGLIDDVLLVCSAFDQYDRVKMEKLIQEPVTVKTDQNLLSQVLVNLLKNALESFGDHPAGQQLIRISVSREASLIRINISNNGEAIPMEFREQIFVPFFTTKEKGTGIGLSLSKQIMLLLGGDITLQANSREETCFSISLPG